MIVKNETAVIEACLDSVRSLVDYVLIEDTGSTDGTQALIRGWLDRNGMPGVVIEEPWRDFAYNRTHALERLRERDEVDYALIIDADDRLVAQDGFDPTTFKAALSDDFYDIEIRHGGVRFARPQLCANWLPFTFKAVLHEYLETPPQAVSRGQAQGFFIETSRGGARNKNPRKYQDDAATLEKALATETDPFLVSRYTFYLAQSYKDSGEREKALASYEKRATLGYWAEETFVSLYETAKLKRALDRPVDDVIATCEQATAAAPRRAEALHFAALTCRAVGRNEQGYEFAKRGLELAFPSGGLFVETWIYDYGLLDELAVNGYWSGHCRDSLDACLKMLASPALPSGMRERVLQNARFAFDKLPADPDLGAAGAVGLVAQHPLAPERPLRSRVNGAPRVLLAILAKQKEPMLPLFLDCIEALDYPKAAISLYVRTNNNTDGTERILREWIDRVGREYASVEFDGENVPETVEQFGAHEWNATRFRVLGRIRNISLRRTVEQQCEFYFVPDVDNFIRPCTLRELVALDLPIVAPLLRSIAPGVYYSNYHAEIDANGYYVQCDQYYWILNRWIRGVVEVPVVHTTYLVRADVIPELTYEDATDRHEYVVFSASARRADVPQYIDNRQIYGYLVFDVGSEQHVPGGIELARSYLSADLVASRRGVRRPAPPRLFACFGQHGSGSTWLFNLSREICSAAGVPFVSVHRDSKANLPWDAPGSPLIIARTHNPMKDFEDYVVESGAPAVITVRDPRDALVSFRQRFPESLARDFDQALRAIAHSARRLVALHKRRALPVFRYEDGFIGQRDTFVRIAAMLGLEIADAQRDAILAGLAPEAVRKTIATLEQAGAIRGEAVWDRETHWHANHVGDGRIGKFRDALSAEEQLRIEDETREFCEHFGYAVAPRPRSDS